MLQIYTLFANQQTIHYFFICFIYIFIINKPYHNHFIIFLPLIIYKPLLYEEDVKSHNNKIPFISEKTIRINN